MRRICPPDDVRAIGILEVRRDDADHFVGDAGQLDGAFDQSGVRPETFGPQRVADHDDGRMVPNAVSLVEYPSYHGLNAEEIEKNGAHRAPLQLHRITVADQSWCPRLSGCDTRQSPGPIAQVDHIRVRHVAELSRQLLSRLKQIHYLFRRLIRRRVEQHRPHDAEQGDRSADTDSECGQRRRGEYRTATEPAGSVPDVVHEVLDRHSRPQGSGSADAAEATSCEHEC